MFLSLSGPKSHVKTVQTEKNVPEFDEIGLEMNPPTSSVGKIPETADIEASEFVYKL